MKAYPYDPSHDVESGMDLRDWFAGMALNGLTSRPDPVPSQLGPPPLSMSERAYLVADEMMKARKK